MTSRLWIGKFALNAGQALKPVDLGVTEALWLEGFDDLSSDVLEAAFQKALRTCKFWPVKVADVREHVEHAQVNATEEEAARKWTQVLEYIRLHWNPDIPPKNAPRISERTQRAINAAGGFAYLADCEPEAKQWARKRFLEQYIRYAELQQEQFLLPEGEVKNLLADVATTKALPYSGPTVEELHARGVAYSEELKKAGTEQPSIKRAIRAVAGELAPRPPMQPLNEQKRILRERGFLQ